MRHVIGSAILSAALFATAADAQEQVPDPAGSEIVVTGNRDREEQVRDFVDALTPSPGGSIPRFIDAVCPTVTGLGPGPKQAVIDRLRVVAAAADIPVGPAGCTPNMFVIATPDKRAFIELLSRKRPQSFGLMSAREIRRLARSEGPAAAWQLEGPVTAGGVPLQYDERLGAYKNSTTEAASRISGVARRAFDAAALVVETGALDGITSVQLADYAAMRLFAKLDPARLPADAPSTILAALTTPMGKPVAVTMTGWDLGLLRGLYAVTPNLSPTSQRSRIAGVVEKQVDASANKD